MMVALFHPPWDKNVTSVAIIVGVISAITTYSLVALLQNKHEKIIRSPRATLLPRLTQAEQAALPYPPDALPGGRDVNSPYGTIRVYEWGPEDGRKVLLVHGISTPCLSLGSVAHGLVARGCRVMLFDLWGRGYSDCCADLEHDDRLYATGILLAVTSSPLSWTGGVNGGFSVVGYSLGGGISTSFTSYFAQMVKSLVLLAPSGLIRPERISFRSRFLYSIGLMPEFILSWLVKQRMKAASRPTKSSSVKIENKFMAKVEGNDSNPLYVNSIAKLHGDFRLEDAVAWQIDEHYGFIRSFMSSIRFSPITEQQPAWRQLGLREDKTLILAGATDNIIIPEELQVDSMKCLGEGKVKWVLIDGGHDFPITKPEEVVQQICAFWTM